ncbi:MAG: STAS domain-containing protein [Phycisphaerae bacterium]|nr:STAS domain-containing protein [Phycisphaerae bacterium]
MELNIEKADRVTIARAQGDLSASEADSVAEELQDLVGGDQARLIVDLAGVKIVDSTGLALLMQLVTRARLSGGRVVLAAPPPFVQGVLEVTRLDQWFEVFPTPEAALASLRSS